MPIRSFANRETMAIFAGVRVRGLPPQIQPAARRKLVMIDAASRLAQLAVPPANRLEALKGERAGQQSIRINDQWRICFRWQAPDAFDVEICDYHR
jgi:proteic killer suppression protein